MASTLKRALLSYREIIARFRRACKLLDTSFRAWSMEATMILDTLDSAAQYNTTHPGFAAAFRLSPQHRSGGTGGRAA